MESRRPPGKKNKRPGSKEVKGWESSRTSATGYGPWARMTVEEAHRCPQGRHSEKRLGLGLAKIAPDKNHNTGGRGPGPLPGQKKKKKSTAVSMGKKLGGKKRPRFV